MAERAANSNATERVADIRSERRIDAAVDRAFFDELYELAVDTCLSSEPVIVPKSTTERAQLLRVLGTKGLGVAMDCFKTPELFEPIDTEHPDGNDFFYVTETSPMRYPGAFNAEASPRIQEKIEAFGTGLLNEAYLVLGTDVKPMVRRFCEAQTDDEQIEVLEWLHKRCQAMTARQWRRIYAASFGYVKGETPKEREENAFYHPIRLSPKAIGTYPHNTLEPTCLAISMITSSFASQAGAEQLHAGVMKTRDETLYDSYLECMTLCAQRAHEAGIIDLRDHIAQKIVAGQEKYTNIGFHAVTLIKLRSGSWYCIDPNYNRKYVLDERDGNDVEDAYQQLMSFDDDAPGLELSVSLEHSSVISAIGNTLDDIDEFIIDERALQEILMSDDPESLPHRICGLIEGSLAARSGNDVVKISPGLQELLGTSLDLDEAETVFHKSFVNYWLKFVLDNMDPSELLERCRENSAFREIIVKRTKYIPFLALLGCAAGVYDLEREAKDMNDARYHDILEIGRPAYRIGCAVLSDFATYCGSNLSPSFWYTYWPSKIPITETLSIEAMTRSSAMKQMMDANATWARLLPFTYYHQNGIIREFAKQRLSGAVASEESEGTNGQGEPE